jgi:hypothetical protein
VVGEHDLFLGDTSRATLDGASGAVPASVELKIVKTAMIQIARIL